MGATHSTNSVTQSNNSIVVNQSTLDELNSQLNTVTANVIMNTNQSCGSQVSLSNVINFSDATIEGNLNIGSPSTSSSTSSTNSTNPLTSPNQCKVLLTQNGAVTFKCVNAASLTNNISSALVDHMMNALSNSVSANVLQQMNSKAASSANTGIAMIGASSSSSSVNTNNNYKQVTKNMQNIQNVVANAVTSNLTNNVVAACIDQVNQKQGFDASGALVQGNVNMCNFQANQVASVFGNCINSAGVMSKITNTTAQNLGVTVTNTAHTTQQATSTATSTSSSLGGVPIGTIGASGSALILSIVVIGAAVVFLGPKLMGKSLGKGLGSSKNNLDVMEQANQILKNPDVQKTAHQISAQAQTLDGQQLIRDLTSALGNGQSVSGSSGSPPKSSYFHK